MAVFIIKSTELRGKAANLVQGLRAGHSFVLMHYKYMVGCITPEIPEKVRSKLGDKVPRG